MPTDDHVKVGVRIKPCAGPSSCEGDTLHNKVVLARSAHGAARRYTFDNVFDAEATNAELYESVGAPLLRSALDGYNATLLAYGQTGAGKTHTIMGQGREDPGVVMRLVSQLFDAADKQGRHIQFSMLEIYNERIRDLFSIRRPNSQSLRIREDPATGPFVENLSWFVAEDREAMQELLSIGAEARTVRSTQNNQHSSRAHTVVQIAVTAVQSCGKSSSTRSSMICVVDLAGSERHDASGSAASVGSKTLREGCSINKSLTNLGLCISALVAAGPGGAIHGRNESPRRLAALGLSPCAHRPGVHHRQTSGKSHIPYRNSALTWLLRESIGGNSKTAILACVNPEPRHREESLSTLRFADRAKQLTTRVDRNINMKAGVSRAARRDRVLREHGMFAVSSDAQATIDALREEVRRLESTLQAHSGETGTAGAAGLIPGGLITTVNGRKVEHKFGSAERPVTFKHGDRVTFWDPASQQEHAFLHLESTEAPKQQVGDEHTSQPADTVAREEEQNQATTYAEAEHAPAAPDLNSSMVSFLEAEEMAYTSRSRRLSLDSSLPLVHDRSPHDATRQRFSTEVSKNGPSVSQQSWEERKDHMDKLHRRKRKQRQGSRMALKTSAVASTSRDTAIASVGLDADTSSRYDALYRCTASWAPCAVFILGCAAAAFSPSTGQNDTAQLPQGEFSAEVTEHATQIQQSVPQFGTTVIVDWTPSVIGALGWTALVYTIFRRWRRWLTSHKSNSKEGAKQEYLAYAREPFASEESLGMHKRRQKPRHRRQPIDKAPTERHCEIEEHRLRRHRRRHREVNERDKGDHARVPNRRAERKQENARRPSCQPAAATAQPQRKDQLPANRHDHSRQKQQHIENSAARGQGLRNHSKSKRQVGTSRLSTEVLQDKTNMVGQEDVDTVQSRSVNANCEVSEARCRQRRRERRERIDEKHTQRHMEPRHDLDKRQHGLSKTAQFNEAWQEQCSDALAV